MRADPPDTSSGLKPSRQMRCRTGMVVPVIPASWPVNLHLVLALFGTSVGNHEIKTRTLMDYLVAIYSSLGYQTSYWW